MARRHPDEAPDFDYIGWDKESGEYLAFTTLDEATDWVWVDTETRLLWPVLDIRLDEPRYAKVVRTKSLVTGDQLEDLQSEDVSRRRSAGRAAAQQLQRTVRGGHATRLPDPDNEVHGDRPLIDLVDEQEGHGGRLPEMPPPGDVHIVTSAEGSALTGVTRKGRS